MRLKNEPHQSFMSECKALEEYAHTLDINNDENSCFETMSQCHLALIRNEKQDDRKRGTCEHNELKDESNKMIEEMKQLGKT